MSLKDSLPDDLKNEPALQNFEDVGALAKSFVEAKRYQGQSIKIPGEDAGDEDWTAFNSKIIEKVPGVMLKPNFDDSASSDAFFRSIGMPEKIDGYTIPEIKGLPEGYTVNQTVIDAIRAMSHEAKLTNKQFSTMVTKIVANDAKKFTQDNEGVQKNNTDLRAKWGAAYDQNIKAVKSVLVQLDAPANVIENVKNGKTSVEDMEWMLSIYKSIGKEDPGPNDEGQGFTGVMSPNEAKDAIAEINNNPNHPYWVGRGEEKKRAIDRMIQLQRWANPA